MYIAKLAEAAAFGPGDDEEDVLFDDAVDDFDDEEVIDDVS